MKKLILVLVLFSVSNTVFACTMFTLTRNGRTLTGNNEDYNYSSTRMWTVSGKDGEYGRIYFGYSNMYRQGGMNEKGLVFDGFATKYKAINNEGKIQYDGDLVDMIMAKCVTIDEVVAMFDKYQINIETAQLMFVDKSGNSVIVEGDDYIFKKGDYQVVTNFYQSEINDKTEVSCERFKIAESMLDTSNATVNNVRKILAGVHNEWDGGGTLYSNIYDADNMLIYLYLNHDYENVVVIDVMKELREEKIIELFSMFPPTFITMKAHKQIKETIVLEDELLDIGQKEGINSLLENFQKKYDGYKKIQILNEEYKKINNEYGVGSESNIATRTLNIIGYKFLNEERYSDAILVFNYNVKLYPEVANVYDSLGEAYLKSGDKENALINYKKAVELDSKNLNAQKIINQLQKKE